MPRDSAFANRLKANHRHWSRWAARQGLTAYRFYDRDIPEFPFAADWYAGRVHLSEYPRRRTLREGALEALRREAVSDIADALGIAPESIYVKTHIPKPWGRAQYERLSHESVQVVVEEQGLKFRVNLTDYLDTGLFLDHRLTRAQVRSEASGKRFLNLFAYTGAFTVYAAAGGAENTASVDLSKSYLDWAADNLSLNRLDQGRHELIAADVAEWLASAVKTSRKYDLVVVDPPSFSASRKGKRFEVQKDHGHLLSQVAALLAPGGQIYFSTNFHGFELDPRLSSQLSFEELTPKSLPPDFQRHPPHRCWRMAAGPASAHRKGGV
jgi:23S rRNA (cytosine1962-C5)-methyltransferase